MNTSKSLPEILDWFVEDHIDLRSMDAESKAAYLADRAAATTAIVEAVEGLVDKATHYTVKPDGSYIDQDELRQAIKEWQ